MNATTATFNADLKAFAKKLDLGIGVVVEKIGQDLFTKIVKRTPVDTGRMRASWAVSLSEPSGFVPGQEGPFAAPAFNAGQITGMTTLWIVSNLVYAEPLENGHSGQAPQGMVKISVAETAAEIQTILGQIS
jgi:hypothetical protein